MQNFLNNLAYYSSLAIIGIIAIICFIILLIWLFIRSAVASGTKQGILDAYNAINANNPDAEKATNNMFDNDEKGLIYILLLILIIGLIIAYSFFING